MTFNRKGRRKMQYYLKSKEEALAEVQTTVEGLTTSEAEARIAANGKNK